MATVSGELSALLYELLLFSSFKNLEVGSQIYNLYEVCHIYLSGLWKLFFSAWRLTVSFSLTNAETTWKFRQVRSVCSLSLSLLLSQEPGLGLTRPVTFPASLQFPFPSSLSLLGLFLHFSLASIFSICEFYVGAQLNYSTNLSL